MQIFIAELHLGAKAHPFGILRRSTGVPGMGLSDFPAEESDGSDLISPFVYS